MTKEHKKRDGEAKDALLSPEEIARLRQEAKKTSAYCRDLFAHLRPENREGEKKKD